MCTNGDLRPATEGISAQPEIYLASKWVTVSTLSRIGYQGKLEIGQPTQMGGRTEIIQPPWTSPIPQYTHSDLISGSWHDLRSNKYYETCISTSTSLKGWPCMVTEVVGASVRIS